jgi:hypothetical protein
VRVINQSRPGERGPEDCVLLAIPFTIESFVQSADCMARAYFTRSAPLCDPDIFSANCDLNISAGSRRRFCKLNRCLQRHRKRPLRAHITRRCADRYRADTSIAETMDCSRWSKLNKRIPLALSTRFPELSSDPTPDSSSALFSVARFSSLSIQFSGFLL